MFRRWIWSIPFVALFAAGCGEPLPPITDCVAGAGMVPDCRFTNPEDLAVVPGGGYLLVSQMGGMDGSKSGNLVSYQPDGDIRPLFPAAELSPRRDWGEESCPPPDLSLFSPRADLSAKAVLAHEGSPMGAATVALEMDGQIYLGTFAGDRITRAPLEVLK